MSHPGEPLLPARYYALLCDWLKTIGIDVARVLEIAGIPSVDIHGPDASLRLSQVDALLKAAMDASGRADLAFDWGKQIKLGSHDILGYAILSSPTVDYALSLAARYFRLITPTFRMTYRRGIHSASLEFRPVMPMQPQTLLFHLEGISISMHEQIKFMLGGSMPSYEIHLSSKQPSHHDRYRELAPARWHFEARQLPGIDAVLSTDLIDRTLAMADRNALGMAETRCEAMLQRLTQRSGGLSEWVVMMLHEANGAPPTLEELAHILHITSRTLDRRLQKEGGHFLDMARRVRLDKAKKLLTTEGLSVTQVALQLGYRHVANFTRAFKRDNGISPSEFVAGAAASGRDEAASLKR